MAEIIRADKFFSIWIFIYTIAYIFKLVPYNPIILICIALTFFIISLIIIIYNLNQNTLLFYYIMINTIAKIIPLFIIIDNKISNNDIIFTVYFVLLYLIYMQYIKEDIICVYTDYIDFIIDKDKGKESSFYNIYIQIQNKLNFNNL
jgi:hypothetical protein